MENTNKLNEADSNIKIEPVETPLTITNKIRDVGSKGIPILLVIGTVSAFSASIYAAIKASPPALTSCSTEHTRYNCDIGHGFAEVRRAQWQREKDTEAKELARVTQIEDAGINAAKKAKKEEIARITKERLCETQPEVCYKDQVAQEKKELVENLAGVNTNRCETQFASNTPTGRDAVLRQELNIEICKYRDLQKNRAVLGEEIARPKLMSSYNNICSLKNELNISDPNCKKKVVQSGHHRKRHRQG